MGNPYFLFFQIEPVLIIFACDAAAQESNNLSIKCYQLQQNFPMVLKENEELEKLQNLIKKKGPKFTAANFFEIKRSTLLSLISTTTTYMIVVLQLNFLWVHTDLTHMHSNDVVILMHELLDDAWNRVISGLHINC